MRLGLFALLTISGFLIFAFTMTFVPVLPVWANYASRAGFLAIFGALWWVARDGHRLSRFRPVYFAYFTAVLGLSLGFFFADRGLKLFGLTTQTPVGIAVAKFLQASLIVIGILAVARLCGEALASPPSGALSPGRGLSFLVRVEVRKTAPSLGERVARCRRFHQPERAG